MSPGQLHSHQMTKIYDKLCKYLNISSNFQIRRVVCNSSVKADTKLSIQCQRPGSLGIQFRYSLLVQLICEWDVQEWMD